MKNFLYILLLLLTLKACGNKTHNKDKEAATISGEISFKPIRVSDAFQSASGPCFTKDHQGNIVLSWVQAQEGNG